MTSSPLQKTIAHIARVSGRGYWSGQPITLSFLPADAGSGIVFRRVDLPGRPIVPALAKYRVETNLRTKLVYQGTTVEMIEHVMAALYGMGIDNCTVECDACEMPAMDGSAMEMAIAIEQAGTRTQAVRAHEVHIESTFRVGDDRSGVEAVPSVGSRAVGLELRYHLDFGPKSVIPASTSSYMLTPSEFLANIAPARTFLSEHDAKELQRMGVAQHVTYRDLIVFGNDGPIDNTLRFPDECSRHKLLDLIGDLALCGARVRGTIIARRSGHNLNGRMAEQLLNLRRADQHQLSHVA